MLVTPEYNNGIPGVFKNVIDWMSRGPGLALFVGKPVAVLGASPGGFGTVMAQAHWLPVLRTLKADLWADGRMLVSRAQGSFDAHRQPDQRGNPRHVGRIHPRLRPAGPRRLNWAG